MSRRKQAKPRALKRELEDEAADQADNGVTMTTDVTCRDTCSTSQPSETGDEQMSSSSDAPPSTVDDDVTAAHNDVTVPVNDVSVTSEPAGDPVTSGGPGEDLEDAESVKEGPEEEGDGVKEEEEEGEEEDGEYRCDVCDATFTSLTHFMDHRNFECSPDESLWRRGATSPCLSHSSSPYSVGEEPVALCDSPLSPTAAAIPTDQLPFALSVSDGHPYACQFCEKAFARLSFLKKHEQVHGDLMPFRCEFCHRLFKHKRSRDRHLKLHTGDRKYRCPHCNSAFSRSDHLKIHLRTHDTARPFPCPACPRAFTSPAALSAHALSHTAREGGEDQEGDQEEEEGTTPLAYACDHCEEVCIGKAALTAHVRDAHDASFRRACPICNASFRSTDALLSHVRQHSLSSENGPSGRGSERTERRSGAGGGVPAKRRKLASDDKRDCPYCSKKGFPSKDVLEMHVRTMHVDKSTQMHVCQYCNAAYPTLNDLEDHIKIIHHTSLGIQFSCEFCTLEFSEFAELKVHLDKVHKYAEFCGADVDIVFCSHCTMGFPNAFALSEHVHNAHSLPLPPPVKNGSASPGVVVVKKEKVSRPPSVVPKYRDPFSSPPAGRTDTRGSPCPALPRSASPRPTDTLLPPGTNADLSSTTCDQCNATFLDVKSYQAHLASHAAGGQGVGSSASKYSCAECASEFGSEDQLENHVFVHFLALTTEYGCTSCLKLFSKPDELQKHLMDIHAHHLYRCALCKEIFDSKVNVQVHFAIKHSNECKLYKCLPCGSVFRSEMEWQLHVKVHHLGMSKPYRCLFCKESFCTEVELQCHLTTHKKQFPCPLCDEAFHVEYLLDKHVQTKHSPDDPSAASPAVIQPKQEKEDEILDYSMSGTANSVGSLPAGPTPTRGSPKTHTNMLQAGGHLPTGGHLNPAGHMTSGGHVTTGSHLTPTSPTSSSQTGSHLTPTRPLASPAPSNHSNQGVGGANSSTLSPPPPLVGRKGDLNYKCDMCEVKFSEEGALEKHRLHDHRVSPELSRALQKAQAAALVQQQQQQAQQQAQVSPKSSHSSSADKFSQLCVYCNKTFKTKGELEKHMKTHVTPSNQKCNICDEVFPSASILAEHKLTHCKVVKGNVCVVCKVAMKNEEQFYAHAQQHGFQGTNMQCIVCRQTLASMLELQMHGKHHFQSPAPFYTCCVCLGSFDSKENLISKLNTSGRTYYVCKPCYHGELVSEHRCPTCSVKFETAAALETHMSSHKKTYQCIKCQQSFASEYEIQVHVATHVMQEGNVHDCKMCGTVFDSPAKLQCHLIEHTFEGGEIRCYVCDGLFAHAGAVQMHVLEHGLGARRYACTTCPQSFFFSAELQNHILSAHAVTQTSGGAGSRRASPPSSHHSHQGTLQCPECPQTFSSLLSLGAHRASHDHSSPRKPTDLSAQSRPANSPPTQNAQTTPSSAGSGSGRESSSETLQCSLCPQRFSAVSSLQQHFLSLHAADAELLQRKGALSMAALDDGAGGGALPGAAMSGGGTLGVGAADLRKVYECGECGKDCASLQSLQSHARIHTSGKENRKGSLKSANKPFPCPICGRTFTRKTHLRDHMKVHLQNVQPSSYACEFCSETFPTTKHLRRHLVTVHNTNADHTCRVCGDTFPQRRHLTAHVQQVHGVVMDTSDITADVTDGGDVTGKDAGGTQGELEERCVGKDNDAGPVPEVSQNGRDTTETSEKQEVTSVGKESCDTSHDAPRDAPRDVSRDPSFAGVTVVTNPPEQVTVS